MSRFSRNVLILVLSIAWVFQAVSAEIQPLVINETKTKVIVFGESTLHDFTSEVTRFDLNIKVNGETGDVESARFSFNFAALDSDNKKRDKTMLKWLSHEDYPTGTFSSSKITHVNNQWVIEGTLSLHGVEKKIRFPFDLKRENEKYVIDAKKVIDYQDWDLELIKVMGFLKVFPGLEITIHVEGRPTA